jgi:hypothetical protein
MAILTPVLAPLLGVFMWVIYKVPLMGQPLFQLNTADLAFLAIFGASFGYGIISKLMQKERYTAGSAGLHLLTTFILSFVIFGALYILSTYVPQYSMANWHSNMAIIGVPFVAGLAALIILSLLKR